MKFSDKQKDKRMAELDAIVADITVNGLWDRNKVDYNNSNFYKLSQLGKYITKDHERDLMHWVNIVNVSDVNGKAVEVIIEVCPNLTVEGYRCYCRISLQF